MKVVVGIDLGSWTFKLSAFHNQQFQLLTNEANFRQTPSLVSFYHSQRLVGEEAQNRIKSNFMNTVRAPLRLIGLEKNFQLVEEELKYGTAEYHIGEELHFTIQVSKDQKTRLQPEHLLISLFSKINAIVDSHCLKPEGYFMVVPSYLSHYQRKIIQRCGEIVLHSQGVSLVDDWVSLAAEYAYTHFEQIKNATKTVLFIDIGHSKCSFFVVEFTPKEPRLLDCQHMRFLGSKNIDHLLAEYYDEKIKKSRNEAESLFSNPKAKVKLLDQVQKQRKVLSANEDSYINIQSLIQDYDLSYNMKREEFEKIAGPVLNQIRKGLTTMKNRMPPNYKLHSLQLVGGASRIPFIRTIIKQIFSSEPSRTLNLSQSIARGAAIYGVAANKIMPLDYNLPNYNLIDICASWNKTRVNQFYGQNQAQYSSRHILFRANSHAPNQCVLPFGNQGPLQLYVFYGQAASTKSIGYLRFSTPNRVKFILNSSKIVSVQLQSGELSVCKMQDKKESKWIEIGKWEQSLRVIEERIKSIFQLKNSYQAKFYQLRNKIGQYKNCMSEEEFISFNDQFKAIEKWIQDQNGRTLSTIQDLELYQQQSVNIHGYQSALKVLTQRKEAGKTLSLSFASLKVKIQNIRVDQLNQWQKRKLVLLTEWLEDSFRKMESSGWEGYYITENSLSFAEQQLQRIVVKQ